MTVTSFFIINFGAALLARYLGINPLITLTPALTSSMATTKFIHSCLDILLSITSAYLTLMVLVECALWILLFKMGVADIPPVRNTLAMALDRRIEESLIKISDLEPNHRRCLGGGCVGGCGCGCGSDSNNSALKLDRRIDKSLKNVENPSFDFDHDDIDIDIDAMEDESVSESQIKSASPIESTTTTTTTSGSDSGCCAICLEDLDVDTAVSGRMDCCQSNKFHKKCIQQWLRTNDSCPCCRSPMLVANDNDCDNDCGDDSASASDNAGRISSEGHDTNTTYTYILSQWRLRIDTANSMRNEILSFYVVDP